MTYKNIEDRREARRRWYRNNKVKEKRWSKERKRRIAKWLRDYKSKLKCSKCEENYIACLEFHHKGKRDKTVAHMTTDGYSLSNILKEIKKCVVLCANCHRKLHHPE